MQRLTTYRKCIVTAFCGALVAFFVASMGIAQEESLTAQMNGWFAELADPGNDQWRRAEADIQREWSKSGSPAFDLLLKRGRAAIEAGDLRAAIDHLTALTDQAPDFAEGWNARATAFYLAGLFGPSIIDIEHVLALEPRHFGAIAGLGLILHETGHEADAIHAFRESLAIHPHQDGISQSLEELEKKASGTDI